MVRLQKFLADAGVASRRAAEQFILEGRVSVNGAAVRLLGSKVDPARDSVLVDGKIVRSKKKVYLVMNKLRGRVCSRKDELGRPTIYEELPPEWITVQSVGRLDYNTEGLIFLTNDGDFALHLTHPRYGVHKRYTAQVEGRVLPETVRKFTEGIYDAGEKLKAERVWLVSASSSKSVVELELTEGKNREVRRLFETQGFTVKRLLRTQIGKIKLGELKPGRWRALTEAEIKTLLS